MQLMSHPSKLLKVHIDEVAQAVCVIIGLNRALAPINGIVDDVTKLHDVGKTTSAFQAYIPNPQNWRGDPKEKAHTPIGALAVSAIAKHQECTAAWLRAVGPAVLGHHSSLPTLKELISKFDDDAWNKVLLDQLKGLPFSALEGLTGFPFGDLPLSAERATIRAAKEAYRKVFKELADHYEKDSPSVIQERLRNQAVFSVLLEADKAFLALGENDRHLYKSRAFSVIHPIVVDDFTAALPTTPINTQRSTARTEALSTLRESAEQGIYTLTLPTGLGKTLTAASVLLHMRSNRPRKVIIALPFLSVVDQTSKVYAELLGAEGNSELLIQSHSLSERDYSDTEGNAADFMLDTWSSDFVITTFDQVLLALFSPKARHQLRFHNLAGALLLFDEVQALPTHLWDITQKALQGLAKEFGTQVIAMSATKPGYLQGAELVPGYTHYFQQFGRYRLLLRHFQSLNLGNFIEEVRQRKELKEKRLMITLNTRSSARKVYDELTGDWPYPTYLLTADLTPLDRLEKIQQIKESGGPCLVVSTQVVEAGVDIDMDHILRDFAPLDSLIQIAGRCNRNGRRPRGTVEVMNLHNDAGKSFAAMVYRNFDGGPDISLQETRAALDSLEELKEEDVLGVVDRYFARLGQKSNLGADLTRNWATYQNSLDVSRLLRGEQAGQVQLIVAHRDPQGTLEDDIRLAMAVQDRWDRRRELRKLASRIAKVTVNVWATRDFCPSSLADPIDPSKVSNPLEYPWWIVRPERYYPNRGIELEGEVFL